MSVLCWICQALLQHLVIMQLQQSLYDGSHEHSFIACHNPDLTIGTLGTGRPVKLPS